MHDRTLHDGIANAFVVIFATSFLKPLTTRGFVLDRLERSCRNAEHTVTGAMGEPALTLQMAEDIRVDPRNQLGYKGAHKVLRHIREELAPCGVGARIMGEYGKAPFKH